jgi:hypothetical protein
VRKPEATGFEYLNERKNRPDFTWDRAALSTLLSDAMHTQVRLPDKMEGWGVQLREEALRATLMQDVIKTGEIGGQKLDTQQVHSSIARRMGIEISALPPVDRNVEGNAEVMLDATCHYQMLLDRDRLFGWHAALFPSGRSGRQKIIVGGWRTDASGPIQVISGADGREKVHYEAPPQATG